MKIKIFTVIVFSFLIAFVASPVRAEDSPGARGLFHLLNNFQHQATGSAEPRLRNLEKHATQSAELVQKRLTEIIKHADTLIANRISSLNNLNSHIQADSKLSDADKAVLATQVQSAISGLNTLKAKIDADTDADTALADAKTIITDYRVYMVLEPQTRLLMILNNLHSMAAKIQALVPKLQDLINNLQTQGKDVSQLTPLISDINTQLQTIMTTFTTDITVVQGVTPATTDPQTVFKQVKNDIQNVIKTDFAKIRQDIGQMKTIFKQLHPEPHPTKNPAPTVAPTSVPTLTPVPTEEITPTP